MAFTAAPANDTVITENGADFYARNHKWYQREAVVVTQHDAPAAGVWQMDRNTGTNFRRAEHMIKLTAGFQMVTNSYIKFQFGNGAAMHDMKASHSDFYGTIQWGNSGRKASDWADTSLDADGIYLAANTNDEQCHFDFYQEVELTMMKYYPSEILLEWRWPMLGTANVSMYNTCSGVIKGMDIIEVDRLMLRAVTGNYKSGSATVEWW